MNTMSCEKHLGMGTVQNCAPCLQVELEYVRSEIEALRADVVWAVRKAEIEENPFDGGYCVEWVDGDSIVDVDCDGTDAGILRAVREARGK